MIGPEAPRRYGLTLLETLGIAAACLVLLCVLTAALPGP